MPKKENAMENNGMITLTKAEMLEEWKKRKGFYSGVRSCDVEREDGVDLDGVLQREMDDWYNKMLREAPSEMLPIENIAKECPATVDARRAVTVDLPARCVRVLALRLDCWAADVTQFSAPGSDDAEAQRSEWTQAGTERPVVVAGVRRLTAYSAAATDKASIASLLAVCRPSAPTASGLTPGHGKTESLRMFSGLSAARTPGAELVLPFGQDRQS